MGQSAAHNHICIRVNYHFMESNYIAQIMLTIGINRYYIFCHRIANSRFDCATITSVHFMRVKSKPLRAFVFLQNI